MAMTKGGVTMTATREQADGYFGWCPHCPNNDGYINVGRSHWFLCHQHKTKWCAGANLFSSWREQTEEEQRRIYATYGVGQYQEVEPVYPDEPGSKPAAPRQQDDPCPF
jgi:hypothetical protein